MPREWRNFLPQNGGDPISSLLQSFVLFRSFNSKVSQTKGWRLHAISETPYNQKGDKPKKGQNVKEVCITNWQVQGRPYL